MGVYSPSPGTIYPRLARLEEEGLVTHDEVDGRKVYRITDAGREELRSRSDELDELEEELSASVSDIVREVREDVRQTVRSLREELTFAARESRRVSKDAAAEGRRARASAGGAGGRRGARTAARRAGSRLRRRPAGARAGAAAARGDRGRAIFGRREGLGHAPGRLGLGGVDGLAWSPRLGRPGGGAETARR